MGTPIADRLEVLDEDWLAEAIDDSLDVDWTGRDAARLILERMPELTESASVIRELVEALEALEYWFDTDEEILAAMSPDERADNDRQLAKIRKALSRARGEA